MAAHVSHKFDKGFLIREEHLRRIHEIISKRAELNGDSRALEINVKRADAFSYSTENVDEIVAEDNSDADKIVSITYEINDYEDDFMVWLDFNKDDGVNLRLNGKDRDQVFLLFSDVKSYIEAEVAKAWKLHRDWVRLAVVMTMMLVLLSAFTYLISPDGKINDLSRAIASTDVQVKLNALLAERVRLSNVSAKALGVLFALAAISIFVVPTWFIWTASYLFPSNEFIIGRQLAKYGRRLSLRSNLFWGVVVAAAVGVATTYLFQR
jgi:hypothetical protein